MRTIALLFMFSVVLFISAAALAEDAPHWTYAGEEGPENWAGLAPEFGACLGKNQSPINLTGFIEAELEPIPFSYSAGGSEILNNGHTVQVNYSPGSSILVDSVPFDLKQIHFHAPSENRIHGESFPFEGHLVHADKDGNLAVVALMFKEGAQNEALRQLWPLIPSESGESAPLPAPFAAAGLLPENRDYYRFSGSLTTPPCTEGVRWLVMKTPVSLSSEQLAVFSGILGHPNSRPVQPVNAREVLQ